MSGYKAVGNVNMREVGKELRRIVDSRKGDALCVVTRPHGYEVRDAVGNAVAILDQTGFEINSNSYSGLQSAIETVYVHHTR